MSRLVLLHRLFLFRRLFLYLSCALFSLPAQALEWQNLWSSPEQRAKKQLEAQEYDALIKQAPDALWRGLGEYQNGDYTAAAESFAEQRASIEQQAQEAQLDQRDASIERASFNQATSMVRAGQYDQAINVYNDILSNNPEHQGALHNRDIAQQLQAIEQEQQQQGEGEDQSYSDDSSDTDQQEQQSDQQEESSDSGEKSEDSSENGDEQSSQQDDQQASESSENDGEQLNESEQQQSEEEAAEQAAKAMEAEQQRQAGEDQTQQNAEGVADESKPLTEREQANEQWLRQIPDDPAGLLERKIQNRHLTDFPKVEHSDKPW